MFVSLQLGEVSVSMYVCVCLFVLLGEVSVSMYVCVCLFVLLGEVSVCLCLCLSLCPCNLAKLVKVKQRHLEQLAILGNHSSWPSSTFAHRDHNATL